MTSKSSNLEFIKNPSSEDLSELKQWLIHEYESEGSGFYSNWSIIVEAFNSGELFVWLCGEKPVGFTVFRYDESIVTLDILAVKPSERRLGFGKRFIHELVNHFKSQGVLAFSIFCSPEESELFWKQVGFKRFPDSMCKSRIYMFRVLVETLSFDLKPFGNSVIELWDNEPHEATRNPPRWQWNLEFKEDGFTLSKPIIFPCKADWAISFKKNGHGELTKVKRFPFLKPNDRGFLIVESVF